jgi:ABC-2 type transport system ATP-binding protein
MCDDGGAIFFSTHVLEVAEKLCDKVAIIKCGRLVKAGIMCVLLNQNMVCEK